ncbi:MAG: HAMP domain-containing histidine kinase, partial [Proteobacteria bacterium]|nr:HAMP domain-containing histidine kinase [Pseudomonadota bacterium]
MRRAKGLAETASRTKSRFLATVSHELRTPLNAIIGFSEIMMNELCGPLENEKYREYNKDIHESAGHLLALINDILELSKAEAGKLELQEGVVDLGSLVESSVRLIRQKAVCGEVAIETEIATAAVRLRGDERKLKQILLNLLSNAVKFTPPGGRVEVRVACDRAGSLVIGVRDTGIGIAEADLPEALEPFGQAGNHAGQSDEGTGLGLPLAKAMIDQGRQLVRTETLSLQISVELGLDRSGFLAVTPLRPDFQALGVFHVRALFNLGLEIRGGSLPLLSDRRLERVPLVLSCRETRVFAHVVLGVFVEIFLGPRRYSVEKPFLHVTKDRVEQ